jgi:hypothetical protein
MTPIILIIAFGLFTKGVMTISEQIVKILNNN